MNHVLQGPASQAPARARLVAAMDGGVFPQAVLLSGSPGIGKKRLAGDVARVLSCTGRESRPCGTCFACRSSLDPDGAGAWVFPLDLGSEDIQKSEKREQAQRELLAALRKVPEALIADTRSHHISVHQIRHLRDSLQMRGDQVRAFLVCDADRMNEQAANAFLKTLEEAPHDTYFLLTTGRPGALLPTIRSRCLDLHLPPMQAAEISEVLLQHGHDAESLPGILELADGSAGRALRLAESGYLVLREASSTWLALVRQGRIGYLLNTVTDEPWMQDSASARLFLEVLAGEFRERVRAESESPVQGSLAVQKIQQAWNRLEKSSPQMVLSSLAMQLSPEGSR